MIEKTIKLSELIGKGYKDFWNTKARYRVLKGSRASKKSTTIALWYILHLIANPNANLLVVRRYGNTLKNSCYAQLLWAIDHLGLNNKFKATVSPMEIIYTTTGQKIIFNGLDEGMKLTSMTVPKGVLCWVWCEEAYELKESDFNKIDMSIRGKMPNGLKPQLTLSFNPWSEKSWLKSRFFDVESPQIFTLTTTYKCNEWLTDEDLFTFKEMERNNPRRYQIEGLGLWGISEGLIYSNFEVQEFDYREILRNRDCFATYGLDFGFTDPTAFVGIIVNQKEKLLYIFKEWYQTNVTNDDIARALKDLGIKGEKIYCDSAEPKSIAELKKLNINAVAVAKGADSVRYGIQKIQNYKIIIHPECEEFQHEISNYIWKKDRNGNTTDVPEHEFSHLMDATRYAVSEIKQPLQISANNLKILRYGRYHRR